MANELQIISVLDHPNIIEFKDVFEDQVSVNIVMELASCSLASYISSLERKGQWLREKEVAFVMKEILKGVAYLHACGILHRDLKP